MSDSSVLLSDSSASRLGKNRVLNEPIRFEEIVIFIIIIIIIIIITIIIIIIIIAQTH